MKTGIILLSGGLDSLVSLAIATKTIDIKLALTFDYGQKAFRREKDASRKIAEFYNIENKVIELDWLKKITNTSLVSNDTVPKVSIEELANKELTEKSCKNVWVPNRNGLFINIAACFADSYHYDYIIIGANKEEAATFSDNSEEFIKNTNLALKKSTLKTVEVIAPLIETDKEEILKRGLDEKAPLELIYSCYNDTLKHCGECESCSRLKKTLIKLEQNELIKKLFEN